MNKEAKKKAVALRYQPDQHDAPAVVAKGEGYMAHKIIESAKQHNVPIQEDAPLVEVLSELDLNEQIPVELYSLVAEVLTFIYQSDKKARLMRDGDGI